MSSSRRKSKRALSVYGIGSDPSPPCPNCGALWCVCNNIKERHMTNELDPDEISREDLSNICPTCAGSGSADSGGFHPWGLPIAIPCPDCDGTGKAQPDPPDNWYEND